MATITIRLFGRFVAKAGDDVVPGLSASKVQELLSYLSIHRGRPQSREVLAGVLWGDSDAGRAKKYLRQALWQLQTALRPFETEAQHILCIDGDWVELRMTQQLWLDVAVLEAEAGLGVGADAALEPLQAERLRDAVAVYEEDLLPGWYHNWCAYERERLQNIYLTLLDRLMAHCEATQQADPGLRYAMLSLRYDRARERTHQRMMRLYSMGGDRAAALRQFDRCVIAMDEELGVAPAAETRALYESLRRGGTQTPAAVRSEGAGLTELLDRLRQISRNLDEYQQQVQAGIQAVEQALHVRPAAASIVHRRVIALPRSGT
jgi:DNA-binding SARP family transcriptional activator